MPRLPRGDDQQYQMSARHISLTRPITATNSGTCSSDTPTTRGSVDSISFAGAILTSIARSANNHLADATERVMVVLTMGWFNRLRGVFAPPPKTATATRGLQLERQGNLSGAIEAYVTGGQPEQAARLLALRADGASTVGEQLALLNQALRLAPADSDTYRQVATKLARLRYHHAKKHPELSLPQELTSLAQELERLGCTQEAADLYGSLGDMEGQARTLGALGQIDQLDTSLDQQLDEQQFKQHRRALLSTIRDLRRIGERAKAMAEARRWLQTHPEDGQVQTQLAQIQRGLICQSRISLALDQRAVRVVLGKHIVIGRGEVDIPVHAAALSREHLRVSFSPDGDWLLVQDLDSHNGTWLAGARVAGALQVKGTTELKLGNQVPMTLIPRGSSMIEINIASETYLACRDEFPVGDMFRLYRQDSGQIVLETLDPAHPPVLDDVTANTCIELSVGDRIRSRLGGTVLLEVLAQ